MKRLWLAVVAALLLVGCARTADEPKVQKLQQQVDSLTQQITALTDRAGKAEASLQQAQEELRWLYGGLEKHPVNDPPQSAVEAYLTAYVRRDGATARLYLAEPLRGRLPTHGIGTSDWPLRRYEILGETQVSGAKYQYQVRLCGEEKPCAGKPETYTVEKLKGPSGNESWLISDIRSE